MTGRQRAREGEYFTRHPHRVLDALKRGELDGFGWGVLQFLIADIDRDRLDAKGYALAEIAGLMHASAERVRRCLRTLRDGNWIDFPDPRPGPNSRWVIRLTGAAIETDFHSIASETPLGQADSEEIDPDSVEIVDRAKAHCDWTEPMRPGRTGGDSRSTRTEESEIRSHPSDVTGAAPAAPYSGFGDQDRTADGPRTMPSSVMEWFRSREW